MALHCQGAVHLNLTRKGHIAQGTLHGHWGPNRESYRAADKARVSGQISSTCGPKGVHLLQKLRPWRRKNRDGGRPRFSQLDLVEPDLSPVDAATSAAAGRAQGAALRPRRRTGSRRVPSAHRQARDPRQRTAATAATAPTPGFREMCPARAQSSPTAWTPTPAGPACVGGGSRGRKIFKPFSRPPNNYRRSKVF